jgi:small subunit ribosomal protein S16
LASRSPSFTFPALPSPGGQFSERITHMAVALRLNRQGTKDRPYYKIVAVDSRKRRDGRYIEQVGTYDPLKEGVNFTIDLEKADKWVGVGAQVSETVNSIIRKARTAAKVEA